MRDATNKSNYGFRELRVYRIAYSTAMNIFRYSRSFPEDERYSLTSQIRRSSRSVVANIAEGYRKRQYPAMFSSKLADADAEATETGIWLDFAKDCGYLAPGMHRKLAAAYEEIGRMLHAMIADPKKFAPREPAAAASCLRDDGAGRKALPSVGGQQEVGRNRQ